MAIRRVFGLPPLAIMAAALLGVLLASYDRIASVVTATTTPRDTVGQQATSSGTAEPATERLSHAPAAEAARTVAAPGATAVAPGEQHVENATIRATDGLVVQPSRVGGQFVGYEVIESGDDSQFAHGAIIVAVNGVPVEDSAAGGELLIAALASREPVVEFYDAGD